MVLGLLQIQNNYSNTQKKQMHFTKKTIVGYLFYCL